MHVCLIICAASTETDAVLGFGSPDRRQINICLLLAMFYWSSFMLTSFFSPQVQAPREDWGLVSVQKHQVCVLCTGPVFEGGYIDFSHRNTVRNKYSPSSTKEGISNTEKTVMELFKSKMLSIKENGKFSHLFGSCRRPITPQKTTQSHQKQQFF